MFKLCLILVCYQLFNVVQSAKIINVTDQILEQPEQVTSDGIYAEYEDDEDNGPDIMRSRTGKYFPFVQLPLLSVMRQSPAYNYRPVDNMDPFDFLRDHYSLPSGLSNPLKEYDFVIVGAGAAGSVLASRLSENENWSVLLLEAGGPEILLTDVPLLAGYFQSTDFNWGYRQEKQEGLCMGMDEQRCAWPRGKGIGGSSIINYMIYTRGKRIDWDRVAEAGNPGWSYDDVLPYFMKSERARLKGLEKSKHHGTDGIMSVEYPPYRTVLSEAFLKAANELGQKLIDYNQGDEIGFGRIQANIKNGRRQSAARAFLHPFKERPNLHILSHSRVVKINISHKTKTAKSLEYVRNRMAYKVRAKKEIILSAGAFGSPQLLMLSGIGPKQHLQELGIETIQDLKVGENIYDHLTFPGLIFHMNTSNLGVIENKVLNLNNFVKWINYGEGIFTIPGGVEGIGYIKTNVSDETLEHPDMEMLFISAGLTGDASGAVRKGMKISDSFFNEVFGDVVEKDCWSIFPMLLHPKSKGFLKLKDKNPFHWPKFYYDYFSDKRDLDTLVEGIKFAIKLSKTKAFKKYGSKLYKKHYPTCRDHTFGTDEYWACAVRTLGTTLHHQVGTCKMGPPTDPEAVVDNELRVYGIKKLRVADTSVIPKPMAAHTNAPSIMVGEKLADILKNTHS